MADAQTLVTNQFDASREMSDEIKDLVISYVGEVQDTLFTPPLVDLEFITPEAPDVETAPDLPDFPTPTFSAPPAPDALDLEEPTIEISDFDEEAPELDLSGKPVLDFGTAPVITIGDVPDIYEVADVAVPDNPVIDDVDAPDLLEFETPTFAGVDLHASFLSDTVAAMPAALSLVAPTGYSYTPSTAYTSSLKTGMSSTLLARQAGTALPTATETAIWGRAADREANLANDGIAEAMEANEALGWSMPTGTVAAAVRKARQNARNRIADASREISIEQAKMVEDSINKALELGIRWEGELIGYSLNLEKIAFESAKNLAENSVAVHNAGVERYKALWMGVQARASIYDAIIKGENLKIEELRGYIALEQAKADTNKALVALYETRIRAGESIVRIYEAKLNGARTLMELEKIKVEASAERVRGFVAGVNGQVAKGEVYKTQVQAEGLKASAWSTEIQAQLGTVQVFESKARAFQAVTGAQGERARMQIARLTGLSEAKSNEYKGYTALLEAEKARVQTEGDVGRMLLLAYEARTRAIEAGNNMSARLFEANIKLSEAQANYSLNGQKINSDIIFHTNSMLVDANKTAAQVLAQLAGSSMGQAHATAGISGSAGMTVSYAYSNDTTDAAPTVTAV